MRPRLVVRRLWLPNPQSARPSTIRYFTQHSRLTNTSSRPNLPFLSTPSASAGSRTRPYTSERKQWFRREIRNGIKYTLAIWLAGGCILATCFAINEELIEREFPTPHEWSHFTRKHLRDVRNWSDPDNTRRIWGNAVHVGGKLLHRLEDPAKDGKDVVKLEKYKVENPDMIPCDISGKSEEWRRGYFDALLSTAKAAEHVEGWLLDTTRGLNVPPEYVIGPSNPRPKPVPLGGPSAPREEDCVQAFPSAADYYLKLSRTVGLSPKQMLDAKLNEAAFWEYMGQLDTARECLAHCLLLANGDAKPAAIEEWVRLDQMTPVKRTGGDAPSANMLDVVTSLADLHARSGNLSDALTAYISLLHARRALSSTPPPPSRNDSSPRIPSYQKLINMFRPPAYPPPPPSGFDAPWRSVDERCQEAALQLHIGEIMYASSSREEGLAWTRDGVDEAEQQMRSLGPPETNTKSHKDPTRTTCRECLAMGLENWTTMVARLAAEERKKLEEQADSGGGSSWGLSFWGQGSGSAEGRWIAEEKVVAERVKRTKELVDDVAPLKENPLMSLFKV